MEQENYSCSDIHHYMGMVKEKIFLFYEVSSNGYVDKEKVRNIESDCSMMENGIISMP